MEDAASQLLRALRAHRSQVQLARWLGYQGNPITDWENGRRFPTAAEALRAARRTGVDLEAAFLRFHAPSAPALGAADDAGVAAWLDALRGGASLAEIARRTGHSRYAVGRWFSARSRPRLPDFLRLVDAITGRAPDLVAALVPIAEVPALSARHAALEAARRLAFEEPWTAVILRVLETDAYRALPAHVPGWIAARLGLAPEVEARCLARLAEAGVVTLEGGVYRDSGALSVDTRADPAALNALKAHWLGVARERLEAPREGDLFFYNAVSLSREDLDRLRTLQRAYFRELRAIVAASEPCETVALVNLQLMEWDLAAPPPDPPLPDPE
jgi:transcriptional regulator with XRE-family HTH domain